MLVGLKFSSKGTRKAGAEEADVQLPLRHGAPATRGVENHLKLRTARHIYMSRFVDPLYPLSHSLYKHLE